MRIIYLLSLLVLFSFNFIKAQNVDYSTPLFTNITLNKTIDQTLPVGSISATGNVSSSAGATYSIPIATPPGTNGVAPSVSVDYSSTGGIGTIGYGWNISGLSSINRSGQTVYHDGQVTTLDFTSKDRFTLDGQRLLGITGSYGASGTTYGPENENFSIATSNGSSGTGPTWFKVVTKEGLEMEYGNTADSRIMDQAGVNCNNQD